MKMYEYVAQLFDNGASYAEIADEIGATPSYVANCVQSVRKKHPHLISRRPGVGGRPKGSKGRRHSDSWIEEAETNLDELKQTNANFLASLAQHHKPLQSLQFREREVPVRIMPNSAYSEMGSAAAMCSELS